MAPAETSCRDGETLTVRLWLKLGLRAPQPDELVGRGSGGLSET